MLRQPASFGMTLLIVLLAMIATSALTIALHKKYFDHTQRIAMLDIEEMVQTKQAELTAQVLRPGASDAERQAAWENVNKFGKELEEAIHDVQAECNCTIVVRAAVVNGPVQDLTPILKKRMGIDKVQVNKPAFTAPPNAKMAPGFDPDKKPTPEDYRALIPKSSQ